jgi:hypothetical protein
MKLLLVVSTLLLSSFCSYGQKISVQQIADPDAAMSEEMNAAIATLHLDTLQGDLPVLYSRHYKVRAKTIQSMVEKCAAFYQSRFPAIKFKLQVVILNREAWHKVHLNESGASYGMPNAWYRIRKLFIAADKQAAGKLFGEVDHTPDSTLSKFDCIAIHELGHIFLKGFTQTHTGKKWADEFLASYFAICFFKANNSYPGLPQVGETGYQPEYKTIGDFERLYLAMGGRNDGWYQGKFQELGYRLYPKFKMGLLRKFIANDAPDGKKLAPLTLLKQLAPGITHQWLKEME